MVCGERLIRTLRQKRNVSHTHSNLTETYSLKVAVKSMTDTVRENGLVPSRLGYVIIPRFPIMNTDLAS